MQHILVKPLGDSLKNLITFTKIILDNTVHLKSYSFFENRIDKINNTKSINFLFILANVTQAAGSMHQIKNNFNSSDHVQHSVLHHSGIYHYS